MIRPEQAKPQFRADVCGAAALHHAMLCHGVTVNMRTLAKDILRVDQEDDGNDAGLAWAAAEHGFRLAHRVFRKEAAVQPVLRELLHNRTPVILCVDADAHWITAVRATGRHIWVADSSRDQEEHLQRWTWRALLRRVSHGLADEVRFHIYPLYVR